MVVSSRITPLRTVSSVALAAVFASSLFHTRALAQPVTALAPNALRIYVVNDVDRPVPLAEVRVSLGQRSARGRTDSTGMLRIENLARGDWHAMVRRIGYFQTEVDVHVGEGENAFTVMVDALTTTLTDVNVVDAKRTSIRLADFEARRARSEPNAVITREQINKRAPVTLSQLLRTLPGVQVVDDYGVKLAIAARGAVPGPGATVVPCPMRISIDGVMRPAGSSLDETVPSDVYGIEVYYGPARLPMQLATFRTDKWCGLVAIWTRDK